MSQVRHSKMHTKVAGVELMHQLFKGGGPTWCTHRPVTADAAAPRLRYPQAHPPAQTAGSTAATGATSQSHCPPRLSTMASVTAAMAAMSGKMSAPTPAWRPVPRSLRRCDRPSRRTARRCSSALHTCRRRRTASSSGRRASLPLAQKSRRSRQSCTWHWVSNREWERGRSGV